MSCQHSFPSSPSQVPVKAQVPPGLHCGEVGAADVGVYPALQDGCPQTAKGVCVSVIVALPVQLYPTFRVQTAAEGGGGRDMHQCKCGGKARQSQLGQCEGRGQCTWGTV